MGCLMAGQRPQEAVTIAIDRIRCDGYGMCAELLPEMIALDDWGYPIVSPADVPDELLEHARRAAAACPLLALRLRAGARATMTAQAAARVPASTAGG
jgi:ferredoxin